MIAEIMEMKAFLFRKFTFIYEMLMTCLKIDPRRTL